MPSLLKVPETLQSLDDLLLVVRRFDLAQLLLDHVDDELFG
jgi:hypothetical protein